MTLALLVFLVFVFLSGVLIGMLIANEFFLSRAVEKVLDKAPHKQSLSTAVTFHEPDDREETFERIKDLDDLQNNFKTDAQG